MMMTAVLRSVGDLSLMRIVLYICKENVKEIQTLLNNNEETLNIYFCIFLTHL